MSAPQDNSLGHPDMDYAEHERTYAFFTHLVKYSSVAIVVILSALAFFAG